MEQVHRAGYDRARRLGIVAVALLLALGMFSTAASAHVRVVDPPGNSDVKVGWVGAGELPGQGKGLIPGGPTGSYLQSPAHAKGLNTACEALRKHGRAAVDIFGPPTPAGCPHGT